MDKKHLQSRLGKLENQAALRQLRSKSVDIEEAPPITREEARAAYDELMVPAHDGLEVSMPADAFAAARYYRAVIDGAPIRMRLTADATAMVAQLSRHGVAVSSDPDAALSPRTRIRSAILSNDLANVPCAGSPSASPETFRGAFMRTFREGL